MELLVQKPQFDLQALKLGQAVHIKDVSAVLGGYKNLEYDTGLRAINTDAIVTGVGRLAITLYYYHDTKGEARNVTVPVDLVADKQIEIKIMGVVTNGSK